jgi:hypothetical protein
MTELGLSTQSELEITDPDMAENFLDSTMNEFEDNVCQKLYL